MRRSARTPAERWVDQVISHPEITAAQREAAQGMVPRMTDEEAQREVCQYSAAHKMAGVPATTEIDCGAVVGVVPSCQACADLYVRLGSGQR